MNYSNMLFSVLLLPTIVYGNSVVEIRENRIKQLESDRFKKEEEIALLSARIYDEAIHYQNYLNIALKHWDTPETVDKRDSLHEFVVQVANAFEADEDIKSICENNIFIKKKSRSDHDIIRAAMQFIFIAQLSFKYDQLICDLIEIKNELKKVTGELDVL